MEAFCTSSMSKVAIQINVVVVFTSYISDKLCDESINSPIAKFLLSYHLIYRPDMIYMVAILITHHKGDSGDKINILLQWRCQ